MFLAQSDYHVDSHVITHLGLQDLVKDIVIKTKRNINVQSISFSVQ